MSLDTQPVPFVLTKKAHAALDGDVAAAIRFRLLWDALRVETCAHGCCSVNECAFIRDCHLHHGGR